MLSLTAKRYIEDAVRERYQEIDTKENSIQTLNRKIENFNRFLEIHKDMPEFQQMSDEIERVAIQQGMISFTKITLLATIIEIILNCRKIEFEKDASLKDKFRALEIVNDEEIFDEVFCDEKLNTFDEEKNKIEEVGVYLKKCNKNNFVPYAKSYYIVQSQNICERIENNQIPINLYWQYTSYLFISYLELVFKIKDFIMEEYIDEKMNVDEYLQSIIKKYESKINFKYIPSSVLKIDSLGNMEQDEEDDDDIQKGIQPFIQIINNENLSKIKLVGYAGMGKTTTLEYIEYKDAVNYSTKKKIPVLISMMVVEKVIDIETLITQKLQLSELDKDVANYLIEKNRINLYLDGINEININDYSQKRLFLNTLESFIHDEKNKNLRVIVTDRDNSDVSVLNNADTYLIQKMTKEDIEAFIDGNAEAKDKIDEIKREILKIEDIIIHPIMLKDLIKIIECDQKIPDDINELSEVYLDAIINREIDEKHDPLAKHIDKILTYLVKSLTQVPEWSSNAPMSYFDIIDIFNLYTEKENISIDTSKLLELIKKMGIVKEIEFQKYTFCEESFFHIYYYKSLAEE